MSVMQLVWSLVLSLTVRSWAIVLYLIVVSDIDKHLYVSIYYSFCCCDKTLAKTNMGRTGFNLQVIVHHQGKPRQK